MQISDLVFLLDIAPPRPTSPSGFIPVAFGLILTAVAIAFFLLFRKKISTGIRVGISVGIFLLGVVGSVAILAGIIIYDARIQKDYDDQRRRPSQDRLERMNKEMEKDTSNSNNNVNTNKNSK